LNTVEALLALGILAACGGKDGDAGCDTAYMNALGAKLIPDPTTAGDLCGRFGQADVLKLMEAINAVRGKLWQGRGKALMGSMTYIDVDGTIAPTYSEKKAGMDISCKGIWGYAPLIVSVANTRRCCTSLTVPGTCRVTRTRHADEKARIVQERGYVNLELNYEDVAEFTYRPGKCRRSYRVVALRKNISKMKGESTLLDEIRYFFYITTRTDLSADEVVRCANERCDQENVFEQLKNGVNALRMPLCDP
jgi:hypothetical protein